MALSGVEKLKDNYLVTKILRVNQFSFFVNQKPQNYHFDNFRGCAIFQNT